MSKTYFLHEFLEYSGGHRKENGYWEIDNDGFDPEIGDEVRLVNRMGGYHYHIVKEGDEIVESTWRDIDHITLRDDSQITGWIAPDGTFYGCDYFQHERLAEAYFGCGSIELENRGFVKIYFNQLCGGGFDYFVGQPTLHRDMLHRNWLTKAQADVLMEKGLTVRKYEMRDWDEHVSCVTCPLD